MLYILYRHMLIFDHFKDEITIVELLRDGEESRLCVEVLMNVRNVALYNFSRRRGIQHHREEFKADVRRACNIVFRRCCTDCASRRFLAILGRRFQGISCLRSINFALSVYFDFGGYRIFGFLRNALQNKRFALV